MKWRLARCGLVSVALFAGFGARRLAYWLNTMMLHVKVFGDAHYARQTDVLAGELERMLKKTS